MKTLFLLSSYFFFLISSYFILWDFIFHLSLISSLGILLFLSSLFMLLCIGNLDPGMALLQVFPTAIISMGFSL